MLAHLIPCMHHFVLVQSCWYYNASFFSIYFCRRDSKERDTQLYSVFSTNRKRYVCICVCLLYIVAVATMYYTLSLPMHMHGRILYYNTLSFNALNSKHLLILGLLAISAVRSDHEHLICMMDSIFSYHDTSCCHMMYVAAASRWSLLLVSPVIQLMDLLHLQPTFPSVVQLCSYLTSLPPPCIGASGHTVSLLAVTVVLVLEFSTGEGN